MNNTVLKNGKLILLLALAASCGRVTENTAPVQPLYEVNPFVGTAGIGHTYPGATAPFGMVQLSPDTRNGGWIAASGYHDEDSTLMGFSHTHLSGTGGVDFGDFLFTPLLGEVPLTAEGFQAPRLPFSKEGEKALPGYYSVRLPGVEVELTALPHVGCHHYTFWGEGARHVLVDLRHNIGETRPGGMVCTAVADSLLEGGRHVSGWAPDRDIFFSALFSVPFTACTPDGKDRYLLSFPADTRELTIAVGLSSTGAAAARENHLAEAPDCDFFKALDRSQGLWEDQLGKILVEGGTPEQRVNFYTALYHTLVAPNLISDCGERPFYSTLSLWDTYRTWNPLQTLLNPELVSDMAQSLVLTYRRDGKLPLWPLAGVDTDCMIGYHAVSVLADAWLRGIRGFDGEAALEAMVASSNLDPASAWYNAYGYIPCDLASESVSRTLEFCYDDWCIARMAQALGHEALATEYDARALRYRNLLDPSTGFFRGRDSDGNWRSPFHPDARSRDYTEATAWQYRHYVPHDMGGYIGLMGGREAVHTSLDSLFTYSYLDPSMAGDANVTGMVGQYAHGNEPSHGSAWLYACIGDPSSTQRWVRHILDGMYAPTPDGICGNEDCGQMSAWYVMAALGLYPLCPGSGEFLLGAPLFQKATLQLPGGKSLVIRADHPEHPYVREVRLNGKRIDAQFVTYDDILSGGELSFRLSKKPFHGRDAGPAPYSLSGEALVSMPALLGNPAFFKGIFQASFSCRTPGAEIRYTLDGTEPAEASALYEGTFPISEECILKARAFKEGMTPSPVFSCRVFPLVIHPALSMPAPLSPGCRYTYHRGPFLMTADVVVSPVVSRGILPEPSILGAPDEDHFGFIFTGYLDVPEEGLWEFAVTSDDGTVLEIDGQLTVNADGSHANSTATGFIGLGKGLHAFTLRYLEDYEGQHLDWAWKSPSSERFTPIPASAVFHD